MELNDEPMSYFDKFKQNWQLIVSISILAMIIIIYIIYSQKKNKNKKNVSKLTIPKDANSSTSSTSSNTSVSTASHKKEWNIRKHFKNFSDIQQEFLSNMEEEV